MKTFRKGRLSLVLDPSDAATPAMVYNATQTASATFDCAVDAGVLSNHRTSADVTLTDAEIYWLADHQNEVDAVFAEARP